MEIPELEMKYTYMIKVPSHYDVQEKDLDLDLYHHGWWWDSFYTYEEAVEKRKYWKHASGANKLFRESVSEIYIKATVEWYYEAIEVYTGQDKD